MALSANFPVDPFEILDPSVRWYPGAEVDAQTVARLMPPLVQNIRLSVHSWRKNDYEGASETSRALLRHWFGQPHVLTGASEDYEFQYYFAQREAVETSVWLYEVAKAHDPASLITLSSNPELSLAMFEEHWTRYVFKLATGAGKTKVLSLLIAWSYFHKLYESKSALSTNFLLIAPNIIVLERLRVDFDGLRIFHEDPVLPPNGYAGKNWNTDFNLKLHIQDEIGPISPIGNLFLSNVHRIFEDKAAEPTLQDENLTDFFFGAKPKGKTNEKGLDLGDVIKQVNDLVVLNDEAHHIHDNSLAWFKAIEGIDASLRRRTRGRGISLQLDVTATPRKENGSIFPQVVCSYPLVEAIRQGVVKSPVLPDQVSRAKLVEHPSDKIYEQYSDHIKLGYIEWTKYRDKLTSAGKKPILFVMTTTTSQANEVAEYLERTYEELNGKVLVIHTNKDGEIAETSRNKELDLLRKQSREIDSPMSPYLAVVSVLMLREGWDVQNVVSMVGLRPYSSDSKILPEQTLGRGLRRMFRGSPEVREYVSVIGTEAFLDFVEQIQSEGVELERAPMGEESPYRGPLVVEVDQAKPANLISELDISLPILSKRIARDNRPLEDLDVSNLDTPKLKIQEFSEKEQRQIRFRDIDFDEFKWQTDLNSEVAITSQSVISFLSDHILRKLRVVGSRDVLYGKLKDFISNHLFEHPVELDSPNVLRNLSEPEARKALVETFSSAINSLTVTDLGESKLTSSIHVSAAKPSVVPNQEFILSSKTIFNRVVGDSGLELRFAQFLDRAIDVQSFAKNIFAVNFSIEYLNSSGEIAKYYPDFIVRTESGDLWIVETKGREDPDDGKKFNRLVQWCLDATKAEQGKRKFQALYVQQETFESYSSNIVEFSRFAELLKGDTPLTSKL